MVILEIQCVGRREGKIPISLKRRDYCLIVLQKGSTLQLSSNTSDQLK